MAAEQAGPERNSFRVFFFPQEKPGKQANTRCFTVPALSPKLSPDARKKGKNRVFQEHSRAYK